MDFLIEFVQFRERLSLLICEMLRHLDAFASAFFALLFYNWLEPSSDEARKRLVKLVTPDKPVPRFMKHLFVLVKFPSNVVRDAAQFQCAENSTSVRVSGSSCVRRPGASPFDAVTVYSSMM